MFVHLKIHSDYSLGRSIIKIPNLLDYAIKLSMPALCIADYGNLCGSLEFSLECQKVGIKPIIGCILKLCLKSDSYDNIKNNFQNLYGDVLLIAKNEIGYKNLLKLTSIASLRGNSFQNQYIEQSEIIKYSSGIIALCGSHDSAIGKLFIQSGIDRANEMLMLLHHAFTDNFFIDITRYEKENCLSEEFLINQALDLNIPIVATNHVSFLKKEEHKAQDALLCIVNSTYILDDTRIKAHKEHYFKTSIEIKNLFEDINEAIDNTELIAIKCSIAPKSAKPILPKFQCKSGNEEDELRSESLAGLQLRIQHIKDEDSRRQYFNRLEFELSVINKMGFPGYFLIVSDFIKWSKKNNIPVGPGRGSGAGSIVAWSLDITNLDPIEFGLLFERFLNPERVSMPDFDIDFCQEKRDLVIDYVRSKYGADKVAQIITFGKLQARAVLRDVGRVMQIPYGLVDKICKSVPNNPAHPITLKEAINLDKGLQEMASAEQDVSELLDIGLQLEGVNRHTSTHAAGIVISEKPLVEMVALCKDKDSDFPVAQYSLKYIELAGLMKFDFLGLKTLSVIAETISLIKQNRDIHIELDKLHLDDNKTYELLSLGDAAGVFQFEGAGMRNILKQLKPDCIDDLIALASLYRPGPMDNIPSYINRKTGKEEIDYIHPKLENILKETYGIIIYQEQIMQIVQILANYSLAEADNLRRVIGKKNRVDMEKQRSIFIERSIANNIDLKHAEEIFSLIEKFASYGFNKSHAAAYSIISYQTAYLKAHYRQEFLTASMNFELQDSSKISMFCNDAKLHQIKIKTPNINKSSAKFSVNGDIIYFALGAIKNVGVSAVSEVCIERQKHGEFKDMDDFAKRCTKNINKRMLENMCKAGAFDCLYENRKEIYINADKYLKLYEQEQRQSQLFGVKDIENKVNTINIEDWNFHEKLANEFDSMGFYLSNHPLDEYKDNEKALDITSSIDLNTQEINSKQIKFAGVIAEKKIRSSKRGRFAFLKVEDRLGIIDACIFDEAILREKADVLEEGNLVFCLASIYSESSNRRIVIKQIEDFQEALMQRISSCEIYINNASAIEKLHKIRHKKNDGNPNDGKDGIIHANIYISLEKYLVTLKFHERFLINYQYVQHLKQNPDFTIKERYLV
ncbi:MAG: DNA polymerase III subunit alpha [Proteobacteria bacterium]|nr:DNA polymerase III subunit alpha [Pseudomonadota bacterium]